MSLDLLLINPYSPNPNPMIPLGLASLAAVAREAGYSVQVVDAWAECLQDQAQLRQRLKDVPSPRVTGISVLTPNLRGAKETVSVSRQVFPKTLLLIGGPHVSALPDDVLKEFPEADLGVYGEGELTLKEILAFFLKTGEVPRGLLGSIWRDGNVIVKEKPRPWIQDVDTIPRPARDLFPLDSYHPHPPYGRRWRYINEITSRGCPFHCAYCAKSVFGDSYRALSPERVVADIKELVDHYHAREIHFYDDDLTLNRKRAAEIMERLAAANFDLIWSCTTRCDLVDPELLKLMKRAGCWMISYGVESGNDNLRKMVNKDVSREQIETAFRETKRAGIKVTGYFMIGLPGETEETVRETIDFADQLDPHYVNWAVMTVYPGSPFYFDIQDGKYGPGQLITKGEAAYSPFQDSFQLGFEGVLTRERMEKLVRLATRHFYLRPRNVIRTVTDIRSLSQLRHTVRTGWNMIVWLMSSGMRPATFTLTHTLSPRQWQGEGRGEGEICPSIRRNLQAMKVLLACPSDSPLAASFSEKGGISVPLGLAYLGAYVRDLPGIELAGFDNNALKLRPEDYRQIILHEAPDVVAISMLTATVYTAWEMARVVKEVASDTIVVVGGMHCSALPESALQESAINYGIVGEGEEPFREFLSALQEKRNLTGIRNLVYRSNGQIVVNPRRPPIQNIDSIPFPSRNLFDSSKYNMNVNRRATSAKSTTILTSRGCPYGCIFCSKSIYGRNFNQRSPQNVIDEMKILEHEGYGEVLIVDDTFTINKKWVLEFCRLFCDQRLKVKWNCHARVNTIDEEVAQAMKQADCTGMAFGIESGNPEMLKKIDKRITLEEARRAVGLCRKYEISSLCSYIFGHPGDTRETINDTLRIALELDSDYANFCVLVPMPGSKIFDDLLKKGLVDHANWDRYLGHAKAALHYSLCELTPAELQAIQKRAFRRFYFRPKYIWQRLLHLRSPGALFSLIRGAYLIVLFHLQTFFSKRPDRIS